MTVGGVNITQIDTLIEAFDKLGYIADRDLATSIYLLINLQRPLIVEGYAGVGKTEIAYKLASYLDTDLIRLQCYEGLDVNTAIYEWNYQKQLLAIKLQEGENRSVEEKEEYIFGRQFLLERPLLKSIQYEDKAPVLLIDEIDRADEEFEALLLELLSQFQITIPEIGTIKAKQIPYVILTSNRTRELSDALKRRCLFHWIDFPLLEKELSIIRKRLPDINERLGIQIASFMSKLRDLKLSKIPGVAETLDWGQSLLKLSLSELNAEIIEQTIGSFLKTKEDIEFVITQNDELLGSLG